MSLLTILEYPDKRLRTLATPIETVDATLSALIDDMFETMYDAPGIGLAATQVNVHKQLLVLDISEDKSQPMVFINPRIVNKDGSQVYQEGCLSLPNIFADVTRWNQITVEALDRGGNASAASAPVAPRGRKRVRPWASSSSAVAPAGKHRPPMRKRSP